MYGIGSIRKILSLVVILLILLRQFGLNTVPTTNTIKKCV